MRKNGFTLIELLAIIVILAIVAVITVPLVLGIVDNSKKESARVSAYGYKDAINKYYLLNSIESSGYFIPDGDYSVDGQTGYLVGNGLTLELNFSGKSPDGGTVEIFENEIKQGCLQFGDYAVTIVDDDVKDAVKGVCNGKVALATDVPPILSEIQLGDFVKFGDNNESFRVVNSNHNGNVLLLAECNLYNHGTR